jgi:C-terminal processing protease CtpA/Prc
MRTRIALGLAMLLPLLPVGTSCASPQSRQEKSITVTTTSPRQGWLGVQIQDLTSQKAKELKIKTEEGALVTDVTPDSPAEKAGIKKNDVVVEFNGRTIYDSEDLTKAVRRAKSGTTAAVVVDRSDGKKTLQVTLGKLKHRGWAFSSAGPTPFVSPRMHLFRNTVTSGMHLTDLNQQLGEYFGAPGGKGVLVEEVEEESEAAKAGFKAGDVLLRIADEKIEDLGDVSDALEDLKEGEKANVEILRKGSRQTLTLTIDEEDISRAEPLQPLREHALQEYLERAQENLRNTECEFGPKWERQMDVLKHNLEDIGERVRLKMNQLRSVYPLPSRTI